MNSSWVSAVGVRRVRGGHAPRLGSIARHACPSGAPVSRGCFLRQRMKKPIPHETTILNFRRLLGAPALA
jgi:hypothetical protein